MNEYVTVLERRFLLSSTVGSCHAFFTLYSKVISALYTPYDENGIVG